AGIFVLIAAWIAYGSVQLQIKAQEKSNLLKDLSDRRALVRAFLADLEVIEVACDEYVQKANKTLIDAQSMAAKNQAAMSDKIAILVPFNSHLYKELLRYSAILSLENLPKISVFYSALPIYEIKMKQQISIGDLLSLG